MNPILVAGALAVAAASAAMMVSFSAEQAEQWRWAERASQMQSERLREQVLVEGGPESVLVRNTGTVPVTILEVRTVEPDGRVSAQKSARVTVAPGQSAYLP